MWRFCLGSGCKSQLTDPFVFLLFWLFWFLLTPSLCILSVLWRALSCLFPFYCLLSLVFILCPRPILATRSLSPPLALLVPPIIKTLVLCVFPPSRLPSALFSLFSTVTFCCPFPPGVLSVVRLLTCAVALRVYLFSLVICGCNKLVGKSFSILSLSSSLVSCITQHLLLTFLSVSLYSCLSLFFSSFFACTRCFNSMCFVLHYTVVCYREPGRVSPDVNVCVHCIGVTSAQCCIAFIALHACLIVWSCVRLLCKYPYSSKFVWFGSCLTELLEWNL